MRVIRLLKAPLVAIADDDEDVRESLTALLLVVDQSCPDCNRAEAFFGGV